MSHSVDAYRETSRRAARWIVARQNPDGSFFDVEDGIGGYYKVPYALAVSGEVQEAVKLLEWVGAHHFTGEGDFRAPGRKARAAFHDEWPVYGNAWLIQAAHRLGWFDLSFRGAEFLRRSQSPSGGFIVLERGQPYLEGVCTSWGGLAQLTVGNLESAARAIGCLQRLVEQQPDPARFYFRLTTDGELITKVPAEVELSYYVDSAQRKQVYYQPGIMLIFLCRYYLATRDETVLETAQEVFEFTQRCADDVYRFPPSGKLGLGSALLASITGRPEPRQAAETVAQYLMDTQIHNGCWSLPDEEVYRTIKNKTDPEIVMDITAEFATFLCEIAGLLSGVPSRPA